jgi:hypothetical protein
MAKPRVMLGGVPIRPFFHGMPQQTYTPFGDGPVLRRSRGRAVKMQHWQKLWQITVSGEGWMGPGLAALDYTQPLELRCTQQMELHTTSLNTVIPGNVRPDVEPWALAFTGRDWVKTPITWNAATRAVAITPVAGALEYQVCWMPVFTVLMARPTRGLDAGTNVHSWSFTAEERGE